MAASLVIYIYIYIAALLTKFLAMKTMILLFFLALGALPFANADSGAPLKGETTFHHFDKNGNYIGSTYVNDGFDCEFVDHESDGILYWHGDDC